MLLAVPIGLIGSWAAAPLFADLVYGVSQREISSLAMAVALAIAAGVLGTIVPARRAARADVVKLLRES